jgi:PAS domain S-box-containing protein
LELLMGLRARLTTAMVALVLLTATVLALLAYRSVESVVVPRALDRLTLHARLLAVELSASVAGARADVLGFRAANTIIGMIRESRAGGGGSIDPIDPLAPRDWARQLSTRFASELAAKSAYSQFRVIRADGKEIVRVDRSGPLGAIRIVPNDELQSVADRDYFRRAIALPSGMVDVSSVELARQHGAIEQPPVPELKISTPVFVPDGGPFGIILINLDLRPGFAHIRSSVDAGDMVYVVNERGDYLLHPDRDREFGFELGRPYRVQDDFPGIVEAGLLGGGPGKVLKNSAAEAFAVAAASVRLAEGPRITLIRTMTHERLVSAAHAARDAGLLGGLAAVLGATLLAVIMARSLTRPLQQITQAAERFARNEPISVPVDAKGEIGVLARAFARMTAEVEEKSVALAQQIGDRRRLIETSPDLITVFDRRAVIIQVNPSCEAILGYRADEVIGHSGAEFLHPDDLDVAREAMSGARRGRNIRNLVLRCLSKDGRVVTMAWSGVWSEPEQHTFLIGRDMSAQIALEQQLRHAQKMDSIGQLTGGVAHDFNNLLTVITGTIEILRDGVADRPRLAAIAKMIDDAAMRGAALTQQLLAFARRQPLQPRPTDINALVIDTAKLLRSTIGEQIEIESLLDDTWPAQVDPSQLGIALINLAINARDAMPAGGKLILQTSNTVLDRLEAGTDSEVEPGQYVMIAVSDTGTGIPTEIRDKVFEPFFTTKGVGKGTGLGLSMVYGFVKQSGGHVDITSREGHGTTVWLYLPRARDEFIEAESGSIAGPTGGDETILVVEDDNQVRRYVVTELESIGYATLSAANGAEALALLSNGVQIDLLFTDVIMPGQMNGGELAREVARLRPEVKILYTSGYAENAIVHRGRLDPGVALLIKPYRKTDLARKVREALDGPAAERPAARAVPSAR